MFHALQQKGSPFQSAPGGEAGGNTLALTCSELVGCRPEFAEQVVPGVQSGSRAEGEQQAGANLSSRTGSVGLDPQNCTLCRLVKPRGRGRLALARHPLCHTVRGSAKVDPLHGQDRHLPRRVSVQPDGTPPGSPDPCQSPSVPVL